MHSSSFRSGLMAGGIIGAVLGMAMYSYTHRNRRSGMSAVINRAGDMARDMSQGIEKGWTD
ncbi:MAG: hypothetical protein GXY50_08455 [Syntrophomonadaceae bacterium]|nr:hypothetical protein [Syntrophomonadaceae bacterium]